MQRTIHPTRLNHRQQPSHPQQPNPQDARRAKLRTSQPKPVPGSHPTWEELLGER